jgi:hypothetical protein
MNNQSKESPAALMRAVGKCVMQAATHDAATFFFSGK